MASSGGHARERLQGHYYLPISVHGFALYRSAGVPTFNVDQIKTPSITVYISLIRDEANELGPERWPRPE